MIELDGFDSLKYDDNLAEQGKVFTYPFGDKEITITARMIGPSNTRFHEKRSKSAEREANAERMALPISKEAKDATFLGDIYDTCILAWSGFIVGGKELKLTRENWIGVMSEPKVGRKIFQNFLDEVTDASQFLPVEKEKSAAGN